MNLRSIFTSIYIGEVYFVKTLLDNEGIQSEIIDENITSIAPHLSVAVHGAKIIVADKDLQKAQEVIKEYLEKSKTQPKEKVEAPENDSACPKCGNTNLSVSQFPMRFSTLLIGILTFLPIPIRKKHCQCNNCGAYWKMKKGTYGK